MRKITQLAINAFNRGRAFSLDNTTVKTTPETVVLSLHGNQIAFKDALGLMITTAGWNTPTTKERLNGLDGVSVYTKKGQLYLNGKAWDGSWVNVQEWNKGE